MIKVSLRNIEHLIESAAASWDLPVKSPLHYRSVTVVQLFRVTRVLTKDGMLEGIRGGGGDERVSGGSSSDRGKIEASSPV